MSYKWEIMRADKYDVLGRRMSRERIKLDEDVAWELIHEIADHIEELTITEEERKLADEDGQRSEEQGELYCDITDDVAQIVENYFHIEGVSDDR